MYDCCLGIDMCIVHVLSFLSANEFPSLRESQSREKIDPIPYPTYITYVTSICNFYILTPTPRYFPEKPASLWMAQSPRHSTSSEPTLEDYWEASAWATVQIL